SSCAPRLPACCACSCGPISIPTPMSRSSACARWPSRSRSMAPSSPRSKWRAPGATAVTSFGSELILARLHGLHPKVIDLSLERTGRLLEHLGHAGRRVAPVVHIAGTNGKGSALAMRDFMLRAAGRRVQRYVSPHLVRFTERILFDGRPIAEAELADVLDVCERLNDGAPI